MRWFSRARPVVCQDFVELVTDYLEDALPRTQRRIIDRHLADCAACHRVLDQWRVVVALGGRLDPGDLDVVDPHVRAELVDAFRAARPQAG